jgi:hypothetical protein
MTFGDWITAVGGIIQAIAIVVGGIWGYSKFVRGRTFHRRAELDLEVWLISRQPILVRTRITMRNTGAADIPFRVKTLRFDALYPCNENHWEEIAHSSVFTDHELIESQETITDDVLVQMPDLNPPPSALRIRCIVYDKAKRRWWRRRRDGATAWTGIVVLPMTESTTPGSKLSLTR